MGPVAMQERQSEYPDVTEKFRIFVSHFQEFCGKPCPEDASEFDSNDEKGGAEG